MLYIHSRAGSAPGKITFQHSSLQVLIIRDGFLYFHTIARMKIINFPTRNFFRTFSFNLIQRKLHPAPTGTMSHGKESHKTSVISRQHPARGPAGWGKIRLEAFSWDFKVVRPNDSELPTIT